MASVAIPSPLITAPGIVALNRASLFAADIDFIPTISSDDEDDVPDYDGATSDDDYGTNVVVVESKNPQGNAKRKRVDDDTTGSGGKSKSRNKKQKNQHKELPAENGLNSFSASAAGATVADLEEEGTDDGAFDSEFEFEVGTAEDATFSGFEEDWAVPAGPESLNPTRAVQIDDIVRRRQEKKEGQEKNAEDEDMDTKNEHEHGFTSFGDEEDDELLANDGFGMGAVPDADEEEEDEASDDDEDDNARIPETTRIDDSVSAEDDDEIAVPVPHPDDCSDDEDMDKGMTERQAAFFAPEDQSPDTKLLTMPPGSFQNMALSRPILKGLSAVGFNAPTPIQVKTIPVALLGKDVVGGAVTGSGKTAAFIIPILERLLYRPKKVPTTRVSILMPTRELAVQCYNVAIKLASFTDISFALIVGGLSLREQEQTLRKRPDVVIATLGRFIDHMRNSASFVVENLEILVLDEADRMLEDGFADELNEVLTTIPKSRQTMLFSATMTDDVDQLIRVGLNRPMRLLVDAKRQTVEGLVQEFIKMKAGREAVDEERRLAYLLHLCETTYTAKTIVFFPRKALAHRVKVLFSLQGLKAAELHGSMSQEQRLNAISSFRNGSCTHLLATDLASRGLDIPRVETVINFTVPTTTTSYLHRVGRTARAGQTGVSCTLFSAAKAGSKATNDKNEISKSERTQLRPIIRLARNQGAEIRTRTVQAGMIEELAAKVRSMQEEIDSILLEEKEERLLQQSERDVKKGENLVKYEQEIASRPKRTWFQNEREKNLWKTAGKSGKGHVPGVEMIGSREKSKEKKKLSGKEKKRLQDRDTRNEGKDPVWKKGKNERGSKGSARQSVDKMQKKKNNKKKPKRPIK